MSTPGVSQNWLDVLAIGLSLPRHSEPAEFIMKREAARTEAQLGALSADFRARLLPNLGIESVLCDSQTSSRERGMQAAQRALDAAGIDGKKLGLIIDFTALAEDASDLGSLAHHVQHLVQATNAFVFGVRGAGCCGFHVALNVAQAFFSSDQRLQFALLVAADRAADSGRMCLPVSIMADAASAMVVARPGYVSHRVGCVRAVITQTSGRFSDVIATDPVTHHVVIDSGTFERQIVPLHFVVLNRLLDKALKATELTRADISAIVYPNTTLLDRMSVARALEFDPSLLAGPGPRNYGHAFANDLLINASSLLDRESRQGHVHSAWLAAGSGFTWGAAIIDGIGQ